MYASFFGLRELPFNNTPDPRFFFSTPDHEEALASLIYAIREGKGFVLLTGEVGAGKTLVTRLMLRHFNETIAFACVNHTQVSANDLLRSICTEFDVAPPPAASNAEMIHALHDFLLESYSRNRPVVLMLDEAQALSRESFEQVRMIGNLEADNAKLLQIVIVGQPELRDMFEANDMRQLRQRIFRSFHLGPLTREQTEGYIRHRLSVAGAGFPERILDSTAIDEIYQYAQGLPRLVNTACDNAMLAAYASDTHMLRGPFIREVVDQMTAAAVAKPGVEPSFTPPGTHEEPLRPSGELEHRLSRLELQNRERYKETFDNLENYMLRLHSNVRSLLSENRAAESFATQNIDELQKVAILTRRLMSEARSAAADVREAIATAQATRETSEQVTARMAEQSAGSGRLGLKLREIFDRLDHRTNQLRTRTENPPTTPPATGSTGDHPLLRKTATIGAKIENNRQAVDEIRSLIRAAGAASGIADAMTPPPMADAGQAFDNATARLANQVDALATMLEDRKQTRIMTPAE